MIRNRRAFSVVALVLGLAGCPGGTPVPAGPWDILIAGGTVVDGSGAPGFRADVAVRGERIVAVSRRALPRASASRVIDASGRVVAPGFIDVHPHLEPLLSLPGAESHVRQGVTTAVGGNDGGSPWPIGRALDTAAAVGIGMNVGYYVGHNTVRRAVMGLADRAPTAGELARMREMVARGMGEGAFGLSTGLLYLPGTFSIIEEVVALARVAADSGGIYISHMRDEASGLIASVAELLEIGRRARIPVVITHHKAVGPRMWGASQRTLAMVDSARAAGTDVMIDQYPYTATSTSIGVLVPAWAMAGGSSEFARRLRVPALRDSITRGIVGLLIGDRGGGDLARVQFARVSWDSTLEGRTLRDWAERSGLEPTMENGAQLVLDALRRGGAGAIYHILDEGDVERIMRHPLTMIASDGRLTRPGDGVPHPRAYGTFPRVLGRYVRERRLLALEEAVRKMTSLPAARLGLQDRGRIAEGTNADLVVFDPATVADRATFEAPHQYPAGIDHVIVNGVLAVDEGRFTDARAGRVLRRGEGGSDFPQFRHRLLAEARSHPGLAAEDVYKFAHQAALGPGHAAPDSARASRWLEEELAGLSTEGAALRVDTLSPDGRLLRVPTCAGTWRPEAARTACCGPSWPRRGRYGAAPRRCRATGGTRFASPEPASYRWTPTAWRPCGWRWSGGASRPSATRRPTRAVTGPPTG